MLGRVVPVLGGWFFAGAILRGQPPSVVFSRYLW